ncbi:pyruvate dehydrogenase complex dihydrolipoamide acetyltransferase [Oceanicella actignis]|uniref:Acetyltransferase component of pyruvate dehydrogenase complex n=1 Tax=Oceanicella actignis TaxID=1189325 RepID=A0A1M7U005_9RHOB|nr:pyruvate dehydrogenase complex dihydrolipoamide acetyltransferase [Oceanicella actignis]SET83805.1 pyruvate dehydrogenase E2 component (dihydrolipoamide acetyltransferase) [Oceanicella actignis]SHN76294.1 pyruvate dehydrogenase E2 component (dihydrolipoamide acetyltransferase) [Oceanicella actignis]
MAIQILMPALSPTMEEGTLAKWHVKEGDKVSAGDVIAEIETDKATMEFEAVDEGVIARILIPEGTEGVKVNEPIAILAEEGEDPAEAAAGAQEAPAAAPAKAEAKAEVGAAPAGADQAAPAQPQTAAPAPAAAGGGRIFASPLARRLARELGVDLAAIKGSGPHGRIVRADVEAAARAPAKPAPAAPAQTQAPAQPAKGAEAQDVRKLYADAPFEEVSLDGMRRTIAARLSEAKSTIPHFYLRRDIELDALLEFRAQLNKALEPRGVKLSVNDFIIKACALALRQVPDCNAVWAGDRILKFSRADVAVAVAVEGGLFTPVLRGADAKSISALSEEMRDLAERARARKLAPAEYQGGSFAISNLGMFGIDDFDAVINPPHASILAVGAGVRKPVVKGDQIVPATVMRVTLSVDHRVIDGALGARFLAAIKENLENPMTLLA